MTTRAKDTFAMPCMTLCLIITTTNPWQKKCGDSLEAKYMMDDPQIRNSWLLNFCDIKIKCLRSNEEGQHTFPEFCESIGIVCQTSTTKWRS